jgi:hypothetical protein
MHRREPEQGSVAYVAGYARLPQNTGAGSMFKVLTIVAKVDRRTDVILDVSTTLATRLADEFVREELIGLDLMRQGLRFISAAETTYFGLGQRAIVSAFRDLRRRYETEVLGLTPSVALERRVAT